MKVVVAPVPFIVAPPGVAVTVQFPEGNPLKSTLPVGFVQSGCVIVPTIGAEGVVGCGSIVTLIVAVDTHPLLFTTVNVYDVFAAKPEMVPVVPVLVSVTPPGEAVIVHVPVAGSPLKSTLPVGVVQSG